MIVSVASFTYVLREAASAERAGEGADGGGTSSNPGGHGATHRQPREALEQEEQEAGQSCPPNPRHPASSIDQR